MKTQILILSATVLLASAQENLSSTSFNSKSTIITAKQSAEFAFFRTHRQGKDGVTATWAMNSADNVTEFLVQRTYQDPTDPYSFWEDISSVAVNTSHSFRYTDENVFPGLIYYRIVAQMADGTSIVSEVSGVKIVSH